MYRRYVILLTSMLHFAGDEKQRGRRIDHGNTARCFSILTGEAAIFGRFILLILDMHLNAGFAHHISAVCAEKLFGAGARKSSAVRRHSGPRDDIEANKLLPPAVMRRYYISWH